MVLQACAGCALRGEPAWCLLHGLAAPRRLAASCTAPPGANRRLQEPPARPRHMGDPERGVWVVRVPPVCPYGLCLCTAPQERGGWVLCGPEVPRANSGTAKPKCLLPYWEKAFHLSVCLTQLSASLCRHHVSEPLCG